MDRILLLNANALQIPLAKERTGIKAMDEWLKGKQAEETNLEGLPMFEVSND